MIEIHTSASRAVLAGGQPANGRLTITPSATFEYDGSDGERKIVLKSQLKASLADGLLVGGPILLAPTSGAGHDVEGIHYIMSITADGAASAVSRFVLPAGGAGVVELSDLQRIEITPSVPVQLITGPQGPQGEPGYIDPAVYTHITSPHAPPDATANSPDALLLDRANHTGQQSVSTLTDFNDSTLNGGFF